MLVESYEFYTALTNMENITLVNSFTEADFVFFMMPLYICYKQKNTDSFDINDLNNLKNHKNYEKDVIIDYTDWTYFPVRFDERKMSNNRLKSIGKYFKRSIIEKGKLLEL